MSRFIIQFMCLQTQLHKLMKTEWNNKMLAKSLFSLAFSPWLHLQILSNFAISCHADLSLKNVAARQVSITNQTNQMVPFSRSVVHRGSPRTLATFIPYSEVMRRIVSQKTSTYQRRLKCRKPVKSLSSGLAWLYD